MDHLICTWEKKETLNMHEIIHAIGLCPDNLTHPDLLDFLMLQKDEVSSIFMNIKYYANGVRRKISDL